MVEAADIVIPTCVVIVNQKLPVSTSKQVSNDEVVSSRDEIDIKTTGMVTKSTSWLKFLSSVGEKVNLAVDAVQSTLDTVQGAIDSVSSIISDPLGSFPEDEYWLYLVDEYTMQPIVPSEDINSPYPIKISTPKEMVAKVLPLMKLTLKAMSLYNGAAGLARCLGYPLPVLSDSVTGYLSSAVGSLDQQSSVSEYDVLQTSLDKVIATKGTDDQSQDESSKKTQRGKPVVDLASFFDKPGNDPGHDFCGLRRVISPDGSCIWTTDENAKLVENGASRPIFTDNSALLENSKVDLAAETAQSIYPSGADTSIVDALKCTIKTQSEELEAGKRMRISLEAKIDDMKRKVESSAKQTGKEASRGKSAFPFLSGICSFSNAKVGPLSDDSVLEILRRIDNRTNDIHITVVKEHT
jgi:hypothetical protein